MTFTIWVDDWQMQCCGEPFAPGGVVSWTLMEVDPEDYADLVGEERADGIDFREEHHGAEEGRAPASLEVLSVVEVHCRYGVPPGATDRVNYAVPGTTVLVPVEAAADGWAKAREGVAFAGYLVTARAVADVPGGAAGRRT
ncbi:DUF6578 domain-containing protein [Streptomyces sp. NPDC008163]|uniref:DUF6578 domain-containing protein n=1 Tax=Streptomyces sp. NPDC008163 TaxID=3364818 RepID=UPI0036E1E5E8